MSGKAYLVGAGPGSPDLITLRGARLLQKADVVVHDRLVDPQVLALTRAGARIIDVGKTPGDRCRTQDDINRLLVELVQAGNQVVRLKGGDPFIFGRGQEERDALQQAGCAVEIVPGVSSVTGVPAVAGVPLTHRDVASDFAVITGHFARDKSQQRANWDALARMDTLVVLMGVGAAPEIQAALLDAGRSPTTPALVISRGSWADQAIRQTDLAHLATTIQTARLSNPALIILGDVVHFQEVQPEDGNRAQEAEAPSVVARRDEEHRSQGEGLYPLTLTRLRGRKVLVVGGGPVGTRKCRRLLAAGARVVLCSPTLTPELEDLAVHGEITWHRRHYQTEDLTGILLVFAATNDHGVNAQIARDAAAHNILCNVATDSRGGDFRVPALTWTEDCLVAVTSFAGDPRTAQQVRDAIRTWLALVDDRNFPAY